MFTEGAAPQWNQWTAYNGTKIRISAPHGAGLLSRSLLANSTQSWQVGANGQLIPCQAPAGEELLRAASVTRGDVHASLPAIGGQV
ncbi:hypothetical protein BaRGS_00037546 [Batillaria attramentaria]|uniref:Uncharacterized protein n=1 Tax=Batillaria attramentaria TaxID=370345 RepID=A0ABD0J8A9_9CAEN